MLRAGGAWQQLGPSNAPHQAHEARPSFVARLFSVFLLRAEENKRVHNSLERPDKVLVGGGTGFVGRELTAQLRRKGYEVIIVSRSPGQYCVTWDEIRTEGIPKGTKAVVSLAGHNVLDPLRRWSPSFLELCRASRINTTKDLAEAVSRCSAAERPKVFVSVSGVGYYSPHPTMLYDESGPQGSDWLAKLAGDWEAASDGCGLGVRKVLFRPGVVLGRTGGMIQQIFLPFYLGLGGRMASGQQPMPWIHVKDLSGLIIHAIENEKMSGVYNAVSPEIITNQDFVAAFAGALRRPAFFPLPEFVWNLVFGEERAVMITRGQKVVPQRTLESGYQFRFPTIREACAEFSHLLYMDPDMTHSKVQ